ncbi:hypothetical protein D3C86_1284340 [compost metagenome]
MLHGCSEDIAHCIEEAHRGSPLVERTRTAVVRCVESTHSVLDDMTDGFAWFDVVECLLLGRLQKLPGNFDPRHGAREVLLVGHVECSYVAEAMCMGHAAHGGIEAGALSHGSPPERR